MKLLLLALLLTGCEHHTTGLPPIVLLEPDSVRWIQQDNYQPYALTWRQDQVLNLWTRYESRCTSPLYPYPTGEYSYSVVYRAKLPPLWLAGDTARGGSPAYGGEVDCSVQGGSFWIINEGDTLLRGLVLTTVETHSCGVRVDTLTLRLARVTPTEGN